MGENTQEHKKYSFTQKVWIVGFIFSLIAIVLLIFEATFDILILVLAGTLIACYFRGLSDFIKEKTKWRNQLTLFIAVFGSFILTLGVLYLIGATVSGEASEIKENFPSMVDDLKSHLGRSGIGRELLSQISIITASDEFRDTASKFFMTTFSGVANIYVVIILGVFFTITPNVYIQGMIQLVPPKKRDKADAVMEHLGTGLKKWLFGKCLAMGAVFILTAIGLIILKIPMWLTLAIMAGLLNFIPNFGPLAAMVPAILVAISVSPEKAIIVAIMYTVIQLLESSLISPQAQQKLIKIPPALIIIAQIFVGALTGIWGVIFATPLMLIIIILIQELYVDPMNSKLKNKMRHDS
ncbi:AI-2E family transporter [Mariniflexile ostreae]|uniref:AI-2E family transporter n=1 Tax=Mariniflexile ostreae TaxID=1520892 RepID=A0ABV5F852_9FLAO